MSRLVLSLLAVGCSPSVDPQALVCAPERPHPYAATTPYAGIHGDAANSDVIDCTLGADYAERWHALTGHGLAQPNTFSADGQTIYVTATHPAPDGCRLFALDRETGMVRWCHTLDPAVVESAVEVDADGHLYVTASGTVLSYRHDGTLRWRTELDDADAPWGLHFTPDGHVATVTPSGRVLLLARDTGVVLASLSVIESYGFVGPEASALSIDPALLFPPSVVSDIESVYGPTDADNADAGASSFLGAGAFVDNTLAVSEAGHLYLMSGGPTVDTGALVQIRVTGTPDAPRLEPGWFAETVGGSATSPSISADGRWVVIGDGASMDVFLSPDAVEGHVRLADIPACDANTDADPDPGRCAFATDHRMERGPMMGSPAILEDGTVIFYELSLDFAAPADARDVVALAPSGEVLWSSTLPDDLDWTSVVTVVGEHIVGTATSVTASDTGVFTLMLPQTSEDSLVILDRETGALVEQIPIPDDSSATVTVGPEGELYVGMLGMLTILTLDERPTLGLLRLDPTSLE